MSDNISIVQGDITTATTDAIVNAANSALLPGGGVSGAIHQAAGAKLLEYCLKFPEVNGIRCPVGEACITLAGNLRTNWIIHTVGPRYGIDPNPQRLLTCAYQSSLNLAHEYACESITFPALSCGVFGYPPVEAAKIALAVCCAADWQDINIEFYLFSSNLTEIWHQALKSISSLR